MVIFAVRFGRIKNGAQYSSVFSAPPERHQNVVAPTLKLHSTSRESCVSHQEHEKVSHSLGTWGQGL